MIPDIKNCFSTSLIIVTNLVWIAKYQYKEKEKQIQYKLVKYYQDFNAPKTKSKSKIIWY